MNVCGIIVEYNPFHNGHLYHIKKTLEVSKAEGIIGVMSGNFVQRGMPAVVDKYVRTKMALLNGVDLVIELPALYSVSSAEFFALGAVSLLNNLGVVDSICFGSEIGDTRELTTIAKILSEEPLPFINFLRTHLDKGLSYNSSRSLALKEYINNYLSETIDIDNIATLSNNILGIEYCKSLLKLNSNIKPITIKREGASYNSETLHNEFSSASSIRKSLKTNYDIEILKNHVPDSVSFLLNQLKSSGYNFVFEDSMLPFIKYKCFGELGKFDNIPDISEGLDKKIIKEIKNASSLNDLILKVKSKRYTYTRISRILTQYFIGFDKFDTKTLRSLPCPYARVLGFNSKGMEILKKAKKNSNIPIYVKMPKEMPKTLELEIYATKAYSLINNSINPSSDFLISPLIINN